MALAHTFQKKPRMPAFQPSLNLMACIALHNLCVEISDPRQPRWRRKVYDLDLIRKRLRWAEDKRESSLNRLKISN